MGTNTTSNFGIMSYIRMPPLFPVPPAERAMEAGRHPLFITEQGCILQLERQWNMKPGE